MCSAMPLDSIGLVHQHGLTLIPVWISNRIPSKMRDEINHPLPNFNVCTIEVWEWMNSLDPRLCNEQNYLSMLGLKLNHVSERGSMWCLTHWVIGDLAEIRSNFEADCCDWGIAWQTALRWMSLDFTDDKPASVQTMAWCHMATWIWVNIGSGNGLLLGGTEPLSEPMLTYHQ